VRLRRSRRGGILTEQPHQQVASIVAVVLQWRGWRQVEACQSVDLWHRSNIRWSGPHVNKLPAAVIEVSANFTCGRPLNYIR
jgi:hypothetical protein